MDKCLFHMKNQKYVQLINKTLEIVDLDWKWSSKSKKSKSTKKICFNT